MLIVLFGRKYPYQTEGEVLFENIARRLSLSVGNFYVDHCYTSDPPSRVEMRASIRKSRREELMAKWSGLPKFPTIIGCGWMACDLLFNEAKTKMNTRIGCKWLIADSWESTERWAWLTYDPNGAIFDPNLTVDICGTLATAMFDEGLTPVNDINVKPYRWRNL